MGSAARVRKGNAFDSLTGTWILDRTRSQNFDAHLAAFGLSETAQEAARNLDVKLELTLSHTGLTTTQDSHFGSITRALEMGAEWRESVKDGAVAVMRLVSLTPVSACVLTDWPGRGRVSDTKTLIEGGGVMQQDVAFEHLNARVTQSCRYYTRAA